MSCDVRHTYRLYGQYISSDQELELLTPSEVRRPGLRLLIQRRPIWLAGQKDLSRLIGFNAYGTVACFQDNDGKLYLTKSGPSIYCGNETVRMYFPRRLLHEYGLSSLVYVYLTGLGIVNMLRDNGALVLHAAVVAVAGKTLALVGNSGRGKSTMAAALVRYADGCLLSDDLLVLMDRDSRGELVLTPSELTVMKVSDRVVSEVFEESPSTYAVTPSRKRLYALSNDVGRAGTFERLDAIIWLSRGPRHIKPAIEELDRRRAYILLCSAMHSSFSLTPEQRAQGAQRISQLSRSATRCLILHYPDGLDNLSQVTQFLELYCACEIERGR